MKKIVLFWFLQIVFITALNSQKVININDPGRGKHSEIEVSKSHAPDLKDVKRYRAIDVNPYLQNDVHIELKDTIFLDLFSNRKYKAVIEKIKRDVNGTVSVIARLVLYKYSYCVISSYRGKSLMSVDIPGKNEFYKLKYDQPAGRHYLFENDKSQLDYLEDAPAVLPSIPGQNQDSTERDMTSSSSNNTTKGSESESKGVITDPLIQGDENSEDIIKVLVVYTPAAETWVNSSETDMNTTISSLLAKSEIALNNSNTLLTLELVHSEGVDYSELNSTLDLYNLQGLNDGFMDNVHIMRDYYDADLVVLLAEISFAGGVGFRLNTISGLPDYGFSITRVQQASWTYTTIHEIGHNLGCGHHKLQIVQPGPGIFSYSAGWRWTDSDGGNYCSIMTYAGGQYFEDGITHSEVPYFANPDINYLGEPTGNSADGDNARTIRETKSIVASYRTGDPSVMVLFPNNMEKLLVGSTHPVKWTVSSQVTASQLYYSIDNGYSYTYITSVGAGITSYDWIIPDSPSINCRIRVVGTYSGTLTVSDESDGPFEITQTDPEPCSRIIAIGGCGPEYSKTYSGGNSGIWFTLVPSPCGYNSSGIEQIFSFTAPTTDTYNIQVTSATGWVAYLWKSGSCSSDGWNCLANAGSAGQYGSVQMTAGTTYYFLLDGIGINTGPHTFYIDWPESQKSRLGNEVVYQQVSTQNNRRAMPVTFTEAGDIESISIYHNGGTGNLLLGVYLDQAGVPGSRAGITNNTQLNGTEGWQRIPLITPVSISAGQKVWLAWVFESNPGIRYTTGSPARAQSDATWADGLPEVFGTATLADYKYSLYCSYIPSGSVPEIPVTTITYLTQTAAVASVNVTSDGGSPVTSRGVCWSTSPNPTVSLSTKTSDGTGTGTFVTVASVLTPGTTYYLRAYALNRYGPGYGPEIVFKTYNSDAISDINGNYYNIVTIGSQVWTAENLKVTKFNDNTEIPLVTLKESWAALSSPGLSWYNNASSNKNIYGGLYNWYAVNNGKLCPAGWHVPSDADWSVLTAYLGEATAAGKLKEAGTEHWISPNTVGTNETGFTALPAGWRYEEGSFTNLGYSADWWSSTEKDLNNAWDRMITYDRNSLERLSSSKKMGHSVRCLKDQTLPDVESAGIVSVTKTSVQSGGIVTNEGGSLVTARGVCWSVSPNPTVDLQTKTTDGSGSGSFTSMVTGLTPGTTYFLKAYATNSAGTRYGEEITFKTYNSDAIQDAYGNYYNIVSIGSQVWTAENLRYLPSVSPAANGSLTSPYYYVNGYNGTDLNAAKALPNYQIYGVLYNLPAAMNACPTGWHLPTDEEWLILANYLGGESVAGGKLKEAGTTHWKEPNTGATNEVGFTALPGGVRLIDGTFNPTMGESCYFWSSTIIDDIPTYWGRDLLYDNDEFPGNDFNTSHGLSVRCLKDNIPSKTIGNTAIYGSVSTQNYRRAIPVTATEAGTIQSLSIYHNGGTGSILMGVYSDASTAPATRLGVTSSTEVNGTAGWQTISLEESVAVSSGQTVWLSWVFQNTVGVRYTTGTPARAQSTDSWSGGMPTTFGTSAFANYKYSVYCTYTPGGTSTSTLGNTTVYSSVSTQNYRRAIPVTFTESGTIQSLSIYHNGGTGSILMGIYSDESTAPATRLEVTSSTEVNGTAGWQTVSLQSPVTVTSGQTVWLSWVFENTVGVRYTTGTPARAQSTASWSGGMPATFGTASLANYKYSVYCTYTKGEPSKNLTVYPSDILLEWESGSSATFEIISNTTWSIEVNSDWLYVSPKSGSNNATINVIATSSGGINYMMPCIMRHAILTVSGADVPDATVDINQKCLVIWNYVEGNMDVYGSTTTQNYRRAIPVTFKIDGTIKSLSIYHNGGSGSILMGVYSDASAAPATRLGVSSATTVNATAGWQTVSLQSPVTVTSGQTVWLSWVFQNTVGVRYTTGTPARAQSSDSWAGGIPTTFGTAAFANYKYSVYCTYTPGGTSTSNLGNTTVYSSVSTQNYRRAIPVTFTESGTIQSLSIYHNGGSGSILMGVYSDASAPPATRLGVTSATTVNATAGWQTVSLQSPVTVSSGQTVWLAWVFQNTVGVRYTTGTPARAQSIAGWSGGMPTTFGTAAFANYKYSVYCTYEKTVGDTPKSESSLTDMYLIDTIDEEVIVYPNPANDRITVKWINNYDRITLTIYNVQGRPVKKVIIDPEINEIQIDLNNVDYGIYIIELKDPLNNHIISRNKIIKY